MMVFNLLMLTPIFDFVNLGLISNLNLVLGITVVLEFLTRIKARNIIKNKNLLFWIETGKSKYMEFYNLIKSYFSTDNKETTNKNKKEVLEFLAKKYPKFSNNNSFFSKKTNDIFRKFFKDKTILKFKIYFLYLFFFLLTMTMSLALFKIYL